MPDLRERLSDVDRLPAPDLWASIENRTEGRQVAAIDLRSLSEFDIPTQHTRRRVLTIAAAFLIVALAFGWVIRSLTKTERPAGTPIPIVAPTSVTFLDARGRIAYLASDGRLMAVEPGPGSGRARPIAEHADSPIAWSPDGQRLLLANGMVVDASGSVVQIASRGAFVSGSFSPDGTEVVYSDGTSLFIVNADGGSRRRLITSHDLLRYGTVSTASSPAWSPDGSRIAYIARYGCCAPSGVGTGSWMIRSVTVDGNGDRTLLDKGLPRTRSIDTAEVGSLAWSPDGSRLAFSITPNAADALSSIWLYSTRSGARVLTPWDGASSPTWSPDGTHIAYTVGGFLKIIGTDGTGNRQIGRVTPESPSIAWNPAR